MRGTVTKRLRREVNGQEISEYRTYTSANGSTVTLSPGSARKRYQIKKKLWRK